MLTNLKQSRILVTLFSVMTVGALLSGCAAADDPVDTPDEITDTEQPVDEKKPEPVAPKNDGWEDLADEDRCRMTIEQFPEIDPNAKVELENYTLSSVMDPDFLPACVYQSDSGTALPTQVSFYFDDEGSLFPDLVNRFSFMDFFPFNETATFSNLQSTTAPGYIRVERWEADMLLEPYVNKYDLKGKTIIVVTANYTPDFAELEEEEFNFSDSSETFNPDDWTTETDD